MVYLGGSGFPVPGPPFPSAVKTGRVERRRAGLDQWLPLCLPFRASWQMAIRSYRRFLHPLGSFRTAGFPQYGWKPASSPCVLPRPSPASFDAGRAVLCVSGSESRRLEPGCAHRPLSQRGLSPRPCNRYYGLIRQSDELRPAWTSSAYFDRSLPLRAVRLNFPSLYAVCGRACLSRGLPQPRSAMTTRPNHPLPRQDLHLQACQRPKAAHSRNLVLCARSY
jgi:hypothetical protein